MTSPKPSLEMLRHLTDEHVLRALMHTPRLTRAQLASRTGISRPTISDSVHRLTAAGLVVDTGARTTGRGRAGAYYALAPDLGLALVASITPHGVDAEAVDARGETHAALHTSLERDPGPLATARALAATAVRLAGPLRLAVISAADPVDRATGRLVHLPDAPFLVGALDPPDVLADLVEGPVLVDNDVNWAARAEHEARGLDDFVYLFLGEGLGCAVVNDGTVQRGHRGLVGEIAHLCTEGPGGRAMAFTEVFAALGLRRPSSTAIDVPALRERLHEPDVLVRAISGVLSAAVSLADPQQILLGGAWGPDVAAAVDEHFARTARPVPVVAATLASPELAGARARAVEELRRAVIDPVGR